MTEQQIEYDPRVAERVLDAMQAASDAMDPAVPVAFEELTADPGEMPRLMLKPTSSDAVERRYVSGEQLRAFPFSATLRVPADCEQDRLDAFAWLHRLASEYEAVPLKIPGASVYINRQRTIPTCLGRTERFEDWQVTFELKYKTRAR